MRAVTFADIEVAARALVCVPPHKRDVLMRELVRSADIADRYRKRSGRQHPHFGSGTLMSAAQAHAKAPRKSCLGDDMLHALANIISVLQAHDPHHDN